MKQYSIVLKLLLKNMFRRGADKKKSGYMLAAYIVIGLFYVLIAAMLVLMTYAMSTSFSNMGLTDEFITILLALGCLTVLLFGLITMLSVVYFSRDTEFFLGLPIKPSVVYVAKVSVVYLTELAISALMLIPCLITAGVVAHLGAGYYVTMVFAVLTVPVIPLLLSSVIAIPLMYVVSFFKNKGALTSIVLILIFGLFFGGYYWLIMNAQDSIEKLATEGSFEAIAAGMGAAFRHVANGLYPLYALARFANGTAFGGMSVGVSMLCNLLIYLATLAALFGLTVLISNTVYKRGAAAQLESTRSAHKAAGEYASSGVVKSLMKKEWRELVRTPAFAFQSLSGSLLCPILLIFMNFSMKTGSTSGAGPVTPEQTALLNAMFSFMMLGFIAIFGVGMNIGASTCISREGQNFIFCKMLPVAPAVQLKAKSYVYLMISAVSIIAGLIATAFMYPDVTFLLPAVGFLALYDYGYVHFTMFFDLCKPKLNWSTHTEAVKNNRSATIPMLIGMGVAALLLIGLPILLLVTIGTMWVALLITWLALYGAAIASAVVFRNLLYTNAERLYARITV